MGEQVGDFLELGVVLVRAGGWVGLGEFEERAGEVFAGKYVLEVSSPGVERPLKTAADWQRFVGRRARLTSAAVSGMVEGEIVALEDDAGRAVAVVRDDKGVMHRAPVDGIREARLVFHWKG